MLPFEEEPDGEEDEGTRERVDKKVQRLRVVDAPRIRNFVLRPIVCWWEPDVFSPKPIHFHLQY